MIDYYELVNNETIRQIMAVNDYICHTGVAHDENPPGRGSGRFEFGTGKNPFQRDPGLHGEYKRLERQGLKPSEIALTLGYKNDRDDTKGSVQKLRAALYLEKQQWDKEKASLIPEMAAKGMSNRAIGRALGMSDKTVATFLNDNAVVQRGKTARIAEILKNEVDQKRYIDVGKGVEHSMGLTEECGIMPASRLAQAVQILKLQGYKTYTINVPQLGNPAHKTKMSILGTEDTTWAEIQNNPEKAKTIDSYVVQNGQTSLGLVKPKSIDSKRVYINYTDEEGHGGVERDGIIELRRGVDDISLGNSLYSQVRIAVDDKYYMKGVALYSKNIPDGYDVVYNTKHSKEEGPEGAFKEMQTIKQKDGTETVNWDNPFGANIKSLADGGQRYYTDQNGKLQLSCINKVNDQGDWAEWAATISPQMLSKQSVTLAKKQLDLTYKDRVDELNDIKSLEIPAIKKRMLLSYAEDCDAAAGHLKAKAFAGQTTNLLIAMPTLKEGECYTPNYPHGAKLALVRYPHAGPFEIAIVTNNTHNQQGLDELGKHAPDAIGLHPKSLGQLSGADSDGDTAVTIPLDLNNVHAEKPLEGLNGFDTNTYKFKDENAKGITHQAMQQEMGKSTNLIMDMYQTKQYSVDEMTRAVKYSMVIIDAKKHHLDYKKCYKDCRIQELKEKFQGKGDGKPAGGASTFITRADSEAHPQLRKEALFDYIGPDGKKHTSKGIDPNTGKMVYTPKEDAVMEKITYDGVAYKKAKIIKNMAATGYTPQEIEEKTGVKLNKVERIISGEAVEKRKEQKSTEKVSKIQLVDDARDLMSSKTNPYPMEVVYADFANQLKDLANKARLEYLNTPSQAKDRAAAEEYAEEVKSLKNKLIKAEMNSPKERQALRIATARYKAQVRDDPTIELDDSKVKRVRGQCMKGARDDVGASKERIVPSDREIEAIRANALSESYLTKILDNMDDKYAKKIAMPRDKGVLSPAVVSRIKQLAARDGETALSNEQIADMLGISVSSVKKALYGKQSV